MEGQAAAAGMRRGSRRPATQASSAGTDFLIGVSGYFA
jgi:hypothetical protein